MELKKWTITDLKILHFWLIIYCEWKVLIVLYIFWDKLVYSEFRTK